MAVNTNHYTVTVSNTRIILNFEDATLANLGALMLICQNRTLAFLQMNPETFQQVPAYVVTSLTHRNTDLNQNFPYTSAFDGNANLGTVFGGRERICRIGGIIRYVLHIIVVNGPLGRQLPEAVPDDPIAQRALNRNEFLLQGPFPPRCNCGHPCRQGLFISDANFNRYGFQCRDRRHGNNGMNTGCGYFFFPPVLDYVGEEQPMCHL